MCSIEKFCSLHYSAVVVVLFSFKEPFLEICNITTKAYLLNVKHVTSLLFSHGTLDFCVRK